MFGTEDWDQSKITDQSGKTFLITGSNAGLGFTAAKVLAQNKGHVIMAARNPDKIMECVCASGAALPFHMFEMLRIPVELV